MSCRLTPSGLASSSCTWLPLCGRAWPRRRTPVSSSGQGEADLACWAGCSVDAAAALWSHGSHTKTEQCQVLRLPADTDEQYGGAAADSGAGYRHTYEGWDSYAYQQQPGQEPADEAAQWAAWQAWQASGGGGGRGGHYGGIDAMARGGDDFARYLRPEDHQWLAQQQAQQQGAAHAAAGTWDGQWAAGAVWDGQGGAWAATPGGGEQQQAQPGEGQQAEDDVAQEALGLLGGYGSSSDEEGGGGGESGEEQDPTAAAAEGGTGEDG